jgi:hypothetical protein
MDVKIGTYDLSILPSEDLAIHLFGVTGDRTYPQSLVVGLVNGAYECLGIL